MAKIAEGDTLYTARVPKEFLRETIALIEQILEKRFARHLFTLDLDHGHLYVPWSNFETVYQPLWHKKGIGRYLEAVLADQHLKVVFHT